MSPKKLYLASISPRRQELLRSLKIPFEVIPPHFVETATDLCATDEALYFAQQKALSVASLCSGGLVLASDTLIECEGEKMGKPVDPKDAVRMLGRLSGKTHTLYTAVVLFDTATNLFRQHVEKVAVTFRAVSQKEIEDYVADGEPLDKAGAYAIQGKGHFLVARTEGDIQAVIGLPLKVVQQWLSELKVGE